MPYSVFSILVFGIIRVTYNFFFFSSRRRHTRYWRDWSSDVCSSDLLEARDVAAELGGLLVVPQDDGQGVPPDEGADPVLDRAVAGVPVLLVRRDGVQVRRGRAVGHHRPLAPGLGDHLVEQVERPLRPFEREDRVQGLDPLPGLSRVQVPADVGAEVLAHAVLLRGPHRCGAIDARGSCRRLPGYGWCGVVARSSSNPRSSGCFGMGGHTAAVATGPAADRVDLRQIARGARSVPRCGVDVATAR